MSVAGHIQFAEALQLVESAKGVRSVSLFEHGTLVVKMYAPRGGDPQKPHTRDEIYVVCAGTGVFELSGVREPFARGDVLFAPAGVPHRFLEFTDDFAVWVIFYGPEGGEK